MPQKRIFVAIDLSPEARLAAARYIEGLREFPGQTRVGWERPEKLHITLKFLGPTSDDDLKRLIDGMGQIAAPALPFNAAISGTGVFPSLRNPRVIWLGITGDNGSIIRLAAEVELLTTRLGFRPDDRKYSPHLTLGRIRDPRQGRSLAAEHLDRDFPPVQFLVDRVVVYQSVLGRAGSTYIAQHIEPLGPPV